jgi:CrcB protein
VSAVAWAAFVAAAAIGAPLRYIAERAIPGRAGTFVVNVSGSLLLGVLTGLVLYHSFPKTARVVLGVGFCGAYTTFSGFTYETARLVEEGAIREALGNSIATVLVCGLAAAAGLALASL